MNVIVQGLRVVVLRQKPVFLAVCVDHNVMSQGATEHEALLAIDAAITLLRRASKERGYPQLETLEPPSSKYLDAWMAVTN